MTELAGSDFRSKAQDFYSKQISEKWEPGPAQKATSQMKQSMGSMANPSLVELTDLIGLDIISPDNRSIGDLENIVIDVQEGTLAYGLVSHGGFWGIGERTSAVPLNAFKLEPNRGVARLNATARNLDRADISRDNLEKLTQPAFARALFSDFNVQPYWEVYGYVAPEQMQMSQEAWAAGSIYNKDFDPKMLSTIQGTIESVGTFYPMKGAAPGLRLKVKTSDGQSMTVYAGPREYAKQKDFSFKTGSNISVTGSKTKVNGKSVLMASEINYDGKKLELRDSQGKPQWNMEQLRQQWQQWQQKESK
jgi:sporulation protein YlmC with PRC-barrel domain